MVPCSSSEPAILDGTDGLLGGVTITDTLWIHEEENSNVMIPSTEYGEPLDNMEVAMYCPIRLPAEPKEVTYGPRGASVIVTPPSRPSVPSSIAGSLDRKSVV